MIQNHILVRTTQQQALQNILYDLANLYKETDYVKGLLLFRKKGDAELFLIQFDNPPDFERFGYFVNYLVYPIDFLEFEAKVRGYYRTKDIISFPQLKKGNWLMFYINHKDGEPDNVYITDEANHSYSIDFGGNFKKLDDTVEYFEKLDFELDDFNHIIDIYPDSSEELIQTKPWWKFW